jgi:type II secretory pathway pseudopilin PulG
MRLSGFSLLGLLVALVIVALLAAHLLSSSSSGNGSTSVGVYGNAISSAQKSVAQQDQAATRAQNTLP